MDNFLYQHVFFPTREGNTLDLFLTSDPNMMNSIECGGKLGSSDHVLILFNLNLKTVVTENSQEIPDWEKANMDEIKEYLNVDWERQFEDKNTYLCWNEFKTLLHDCVKNNVPMKKRRTKSDKKSMDDQRNCQTG